MTATSPGARRDAYKTAPETDAYQLGYAAGAAAGERLRAAVEALAFEWETGGVACACSHTLGEHNGLGCYAVLTYQPERVVCGCPLTDDRHDGQLAASILRALLASDAQPEPADRRSPDDLLAEAWDAGWHAAEDFVAQVNTWNASEGRTDVHEPTNPYRLRAADAEGSGR